MTNRSDEEETIQTGNMLNSIRLKEKNLEKKIWREDLAQPRGDPQTKLAKFFTLTTLSRIISRKLPVEFGFYGLTRALFLNPLFIPTYTESHWPAGHQRLLTDLFPAFAYATERKRRKNPVNRWPFSSPRFPVHEVTRVSTCLVMMDWTVWKGMARTGAGRTGLHGTGR